MGVRGGRILQGEDAVDDRSHGSVGDRRPHVRADRGDDARLVVGVAGPERRTPDPSAACHQLAERDARGRAALRADDHDPAVAREGADVAVDVVAADRVEHDVGAVPVGGLEERLDEVLLAVVDEDVRAQRPARLELRRAARGHGHAGAEPGGQLDRHGADAARPAVHEQRLARSEPRVEHDVRPHCRDDLGQAGRLHEVEAIGHREDVALVDRDELRVAAAGEQRAHAVADAPARRTRADGRDRARHLEPQVRRRACGRRVRALALAEVGAVDAGGGHADQDLSGAGDRIREVGEGEDVGAAGGGEGDRAHPATVRPPRPASGRPQKYMNSQLNPGIGLRSMRLHTFEAVGPHP